MKEESGSPLLAVPKGRGACAAALAATPAVAVLGHDEIFGGQLVAVSAGLGYSLLTWWGDGRLAALIEIKDDFGGIKSCPRYQLKQ